MFLAKVALFIRKLPKISVASARLNLHSADEFRVIVERERGRADRTGATLSVVTLAPSDPAAAAASFECLANILKWRLRSTDEAGRLDDQQIGILLPDTVPAGAWTLADSIMLNFPDHIPSPICTVFAYPSALAGAGHGSFSTNGSTNGSKNGSANGSHRKRSRPVKPLESLLMRRMPVWKRAIDVIGAIAGLVVLLPLFLVLALAIKLTSRGPVFFKQLRSGRGGKPFVMYKFRSMRADAEAQKAFLLDANEHDGPAFKIKDDPRVTTVGRFLRRTSLDELPQLWNVLRGDMSLVGPRPLPCAESAACSAWQRRRLDVTPGLTCIWQVSGRSLISFADWARMDLRYIRSLSLQQDLKLIFWTVPAVILGKGAH
jgi:lipopolysaccharide/colanic/teichoic acid biosynthesis glycosyltransferase